MRQFFLGSLLVLAACGGGGGGDDSNVTNSAPRISSLSFAPTVVEVGFGGGLATIIGTFDFADANGNLSTVTLTVLDDGGTTISTETIGIVGVSGMTQGTIEGEVLVATTTLGDFTVQVFVTDTTGLRSNTLQGVFSVVEPPWATKSPMPTTRPGFASAVLGGRIYILGGRDATAPVIPQPPVTTVEVYDPLTDSWSTAPSMPIAVSEPMAAAINGKLYVVGGHDDFGLETDVVQEFDSTTQSWNVKASMPEPRAFAAIGTIGGLIYVAAGEGPGVTLNSLVWYDPVANSWSAGAPSSASRTGSGGAVVDDRFLVYGGYSTAFVPDSGYRRLVESYDPVMDMWSLRSDGEPRRDFGFVAHGGLVYAFGGNNVARSLDWNQAYDNATDTWIAKQPMPISLGYVRAESIGDRIYVFGSDQTLEYTPANDRF